MQSGAVHPGGLVSSMKLKTLKRRAVLRLVNGILAGTHFFAAKRRLLRSIGYEIGAGTRIVGPLFCTGTLKIGADCWVGRGLTVHGNGLVCIGDRCDLAPDVTFLTGGHRIGGPERRAGQGETYRITVGDGVWIGARSTVLRSVTLGSGCVIGACACVVRDIPPHTLAGGVPAAVIRELAHEDL